MEVVNYIILITLVVSIAMIVFLYTQLGNTNKKIEDLSSLLNRSIMSSEEGRRQLLEYIAAQNEQIKGFISNVADDNKLQMGYQKSFLEKSLEKNQKDIGEIKERLEYLSTEVNID